MNILVRNINGTKSEHWYNVARPSLLGNPFVIGKHGDRTEVIAKYKKWLWAQYKQKGRVYNTLCYLLREAQQHDEISLVCYCYPKQCHAEVIKDCLTWMNGNQSI